MLKSFTLKNFKSFKEATLPLTPTVTFLIGANGSGKSNALEGLRFISWLGEGKTFDEIEKMLANKLSPVRGTMGDLYRKGTDLLTIGFDIENDENSYSFTDEIVTSTFEQHDEPLPRFSISSEILYDKNAKKTIYNFDLNKQNDSSKFTLNSGVKIHTQESSKRYNRIVFYFFSLVQITRKQLGIKVQSELEVPCKIFKNFFSSICFFDFKPIMMRDYVPQRGYIQLEEDGSNLSEVLQNLCKDGVKKKIKDVIESLPEQNIIDIDFYETEDHDVRFSLIEQLASGTQKISARLLSDGTLRALAIATALYSAPEGSLLVIEEVDNGIHPSRIQHLVGKMYEIAAERKIQILVTTHDPAMMNAIQPQYKGDVLCCYRSKEDGTSKILRLSDSPHADSIIIGQKLGDSVTTEQFDFQIKDTRSAQEVHEDQMKWLEQFRQAVSNFDKEEADE